MQNPLDSYLLIHKKANKLTMPANFKRGIVSNIHITQGTADVQIIGNQNTKLNNISVSSGIALNSSNANINLRVGDKVLVFMFDETNIVNDGLVVCAYGRKFQ
jgi:hypothetical protein